MVKYYYEGQYKIFKLHGKLYDRIILYKQNYIKHIKSEHSGMSIKNYLEVKIIEKGYSLKPFIIIYTITLIFL